MIIEKHLFIRPLHPDMWFIIPV